MIERILMPIDGSAPSAHAVPYGLALARACGAELTLLHVLVDPVAGLYALPQGAPYVSDLEGDLKRAGQGLLAEAAARAKAAGVVARTQLLYDDRPARAILEVEAAHDLTVLGTHSRRGLDRFFLGSVAQEVLRRAEGPCLVVRTPNETRADAQGDTREAEPTLRRLLIPVDGSACGEAALTQGLALAQALEATVTLLHALEIPLSVYTLESSLLYQPDLLEAAQRRGAEVLTRAAARAEAVGVAAHTVLAHGQIKGAAEAILAAERDADLTVMGTHGLRGLERLMLGSVTERVLRASHTPHLVVRQGARGVRGAHAASAREVTR